MAVKINLWYKNSTPKNITQPSINGTLPRPWQCFQTKREASEMSPAPVSCLPDTEWVRSRVKRGLSSWRVSDLSVHCSDM